MKKFLFLIVALMQLTAQVKISETASLSRANFADSLQVLVTWDSSGTYKSKKVYLYDLEDFMRDSLLINSTITNAMLAGDINVAKLDDAGNLDKMLIVTDAGAIQWQTISGDVTQNNGEFMIGTGKVTSLNLLDGTITTADINASANIALSKLQQPSGNDAQIPIWDKNGSGVLEYKNLSGDFTINAEGEASYVNQSFIDAIKVTGENKVDGTKLNNLTKSNLYFDPASANITFNQSTKTLTWDNTLYVYNMGETYAASISSGSISFSGVTGIHYVYAIMSDNFKNGAGVQALTSSDLIVKRYNATDVDSLRLDNVMLLFVYDYYNNTVTSPFLNNIVGGERALSDYTTPTTLSSTLITTLKPFRTKDNLRYDPYISDFTYNKSTKVLTWDNDIYIYNSGAQGCYLRITAGSLDFSGITGTYYAYLVVSDNFKNGVASFSSYADSNIVLVRYNASQADLWGDNGVLLFYFDYYNNTINSDFFIPYLTKTVLNNEDSPSSAAFSTQKSYTEWDNKYPNVYDKLTNFLPKYLGSDTSTADDYVKIVILGNSLFAREYHTSSTGIDATASPPTLTNQNIARYIYDNLQLEKPIYRRYDYTSFFTETGTWERKTADTTWDDNGDHPVNTRLSVSTNAAFQFAVSSSYNRFNLIDRTDLAGSDSITIAVSGGNGLVQVKEEGGSYTEANGYVFSQLEVDEGARHGNTIYQRRLYFKKVSSGIDASQTITITKSSGDASRLLYWGVEMASGDKPYSILVNVARGGHTLTQGTNQLYNYMDDDVVDRNPDLIIFEIPYLNMIAQSSTPFTLVNSVHDFVWGDRIGAVNTWALKKQLPNTDILAILPHGDVGAYVGSTLTTRASGYNDVELMSMIKRLFLTKNDIYLIDMFAAFRREIQSDPLFSNYDDAVAGSSITGSTYTVDKTHQNDKGTKVYAKHICPIFDVGGM
jgi:hypothetical protein